LTTAASAASCIAAEKADPGSCQPSTAGTSRICAVEEIGISSVIPCTIPRIATLKYPSAAKPVSMPPVQALAIVTLPLGKGEMSAVRRRYRRSVAMVRTSAGETCNLGEYFDSGNDFVRRDGPTTVLNLMAQRRVEQQRREQNQAGIAVRFEHGEAIVRIGNIEPHDLPPEVGGESAKSEREHDAAAGVKPGGAEQNDCERIEDEQHRLGALAEQQRGRFDADQRIVLAIL